jgi:RNA polymerase sigma-70 factor (ECF subfamily)
MERPQVQPQPAITSFEEMVGPYSTALLAQAWRFTHNTAMAQDLVQDTLLKAYRFFHRFEMGTNFWAWLATIMRNLYFSQVRRQSREAMVLDIDHLPLSIASADDDDLSLLPPEALDGVLPYLVTDAVLEALDQLPADYRTTVLLADMLEYSYKDIARTMDCPMGTVMSRLHRGRQMLQTRLRQYAVDQGYICTHKGGSSVARAQTAPAFERELACA